MTTLVEVTEIVEDGGVMVVSRKLLQSLLATTSSTLIRARTQLLWVHFEDAISMNDRKIGR
jgi:hypothetical protein